MAEEKASPRKGLVLAAFAAVYFIWGATYLGVLLAIKSIPPFLMGGTRFFIAGLLLYGWCRLRGERTPSLSSIAKISVGGVLLLFLGNGAVVWVEQYLPSGLTAIIVATVPLWFVLLDKRQWKINFSNKLILLGLLIGFIGVLLLVAGKGSVNFRADKKALISFFIMVLGSIGWAIGSLYSKYKTTEGSTSMKAAVQMLAASAVYFIVGFLLREEQHFVFAQVTSTSLAALGYLIVMGSLVGYLSYIWLLSVRPPTLVGTYAYVNPVVAVFLGWLLVGEQISGQQMIALCVVLAGVVLVNVARK